MKNQHEWEGFQSINDHDEKTTHFINQPLNKAPESPTSRKKSKHHHRANHNKNKNISTDKHPIPKDNPQSQASQILTKQDIQKQKIPHSRHNRNQLKEQTKADSKKIRFPPIPIIYEIPEYEHKGKIVYRGLLPKTSDAYFRNLKDVKWEPVMDQKRISHGLQFNSRFESGNLALACQEYDLYMRVDTNTNGHMQWYYFSVKNSKKTRVRFNIYRFLKRYSLYQRGMRPYVRSRRSGKDWQPGGDNVKYYIEKRVNENGVTANSKYHYLTFTYNFQQENDQVFFAAGIPYTTTFLAAQIDHFQKLTLRNPNLKFEVSPLCTSLCGQQIELLTIEPKQDPKSSRRKQFIIINARSHSGQTSASWVLDGLLNCLSDNQQVQQWMVNMNICFRIVPMLNKDGVFIGNYRTGIVGDDFNRKFKSGAREFFPEIFGLKKVISKCKKLGKVKLFLDLHGHSILKSSFIFGPDRKAFQSEELINIGEYLLNNSKYFSHNSSVYCNQANKMETARVYFQMHEEILSLTCQNSLGLYYDQYQTFQETSTDWKTFGSHLLQSIMNTLDCQGELKYLQNQKKYSDNTEERTKSKIKQNLYWIRTGNKIKHIQNSPSSNTKSGQNRSVAHNNPQATQQTDEEQEVTKPRTVRLNTQTGEANLTAPQRNNYGKIQKQHNKQVKPPTLQQNLQKSIVLTRYVNVPAENGNSSEIIRRTTDLNASLNKKKQELEQEQIIPDNFSEEYESINDSDEEIQDLQPQKRQQLLQWIKQINIKSGEERVHSDHNNASLQLQSIKGFKQYKLNFQSEIRTQVIQKKQAPSKLKPLKYQEFKLRGFTEKKIKSNLELFSNNVAPDRMETRMLIQANQGNDFRYKKSKQLKRDEIMKKMFPDREEGEYLLMRIKEMKLQNNRND